MFSFVSCFVVDGNALEAVEASTEKPGNDLPIHATINSDAIRAIVVVDDVHALIDGFERLECMLFRSISSTKLFYRVLMLLLRFYRFGY